MLNDEIADKLVERLVNRIEQGNTYILEQIGKSIKKIGSVSPSKAQQLIQIMRYGGDYDKIIRKLAKITELNVKDIKKIFQEVARTNLDFSKQFYKYRKLQFIPWDENQALRKQVNALTNSAIQDYINLISTKALGFSVQRLDNNGKLKTIFKSLSEAYVDTLDQAVLSIGQGKTTFDQEMRRIMKELGESGIKTINYVDDRSIRLDSAIRMNLKAGLSNLSYETQRITGSQFDADGWEITVHEFPAEDHALAQGRQFSIEQYEQLQTTGYATDYTGLEIDLHKYNKNGEQQKTFRPIRAYNCYHWENAIVLGVSKPRYSNDELQNIMDRNETGFDFEGKHYTMYQGTQLQRAIEVETRKQKDMQIMARAGGNEQLAMESQTKINQLTQKYKELNQASGLKPKLERLSVSGYHKIKVKGNNFESDWENLRMSDNDFAELEKETIKLKEKLTKDEIKSLNYYTIDKYKDINKLLAEPDTDVSQLHYYTNISDVKKDIENIESALNKSSIKKDIVVLKGTKSRYFEKIINEDIKEFELPIFMSTSGKESISQNFAEKFNFNIIESYPTILQIKVPKGTKGIYLSDIFNENGLNEFEILLNKDLKYKVLNHKYIDPSGYENGIYIHKQKQLRIELEVIK